MSEGNSPFLKSVLPWILGGLLVGLVLAIGLVATGFFTRHTGQSSVDISPEMTIIPIPSLTTTPLPSLTPENEPATPTATVLPSEPGVISQGQLVEITGTEGDNLRLRARPGLDAAIAFMGVESEVFEVLDGPQELDGYEWWYLRNPYNTEKTGWAVSIYLQPISSP